MEKLALKEREVYSLIEESSNRGFWISMKDLATQTGLSTRQLRKCVTHIRECDNVDKIIIGCSSGYKLLSSGEEFKYLKSQKTKILKMLKRYWKDITRFNKDNQYELAFSSEELKLVNSIND